MKRTLEIIKDNIWSDDFGKHHTVYLLNQLKEECDNSHDKRKAEALFNIFVKGKSVEDVRYIIGEIIENWLKEYE